MAKHTPESRIDNCIVPTQELPRPSLIVILCESFSDTTFDIPTSQAN